MKRSRWSAFGILLVVLAGLGVWSWAPWAGAAQPVNDCTGVSGFASAKPGMTDQTSQVALALKLSGGSCTLNHMTTPTSPGLLPSTLTINKVSGKLVGRTSCAANATAQGVDPTAANAYPPSGMVKFLFNQIDPGTGRPYFSQMYVAITGYPASNNSTPDVIRLKGEVTKGVGQGLAVTWNVFFDPVNAKTKVYDATAYQKCTDGTAGFTPALTDFKFGDGLSPNGNNANGLHVSPN
jgi:hypothetical protein